MIPGVRPRTRRSTIPLTAGAACLWIVASAGVDVATKYGTMPSTTRAPHLGVDDCVDDILKHPAFPRFGPLILPWEDGRNDPNMPLRNIGSLLPYHTHVDPAVIVSSLNRMIDDAGAGKTIFYDIYTDAEKLAEPSRKDTGLFFFRGKAGAPFAVVSPGGGFAYVGSLHEGFPYAVEINKAGYNAFVLKYRAGRGATIATQDLAAAITYIFRNAAALGVTTADYSLWGSSAGHGWRRASVSMALPALAAWNCRSRRLLSSSTPVIQMSPQPNRQRSSLWVMPTGSHRQRPWNGGWRRCGG